jgi:transcription elongation GreA/GreB family factor
MDKTSLKAQIIKVCKEIQQETIKHLSATVEDAQKSANEYGCPRDRYDAYRAQLLRQRDMFAQQLQKAQEQLDVLNRIPSEEVFEKVEFGAAVITDKNKLFISIGLGKVKISKSGSKTTEEYYAISPQVPIYKAMDGKRAGDTFNFNGQVFTIQGIF